MEKLDYLNRMQIDIGELLPLDADYVFLVGAGISMEDPTKLPSARQIVQGLIEKFAPKEDIQPLLSLENLKYELVVDKIQSIFDKKLKFMDYFELITNPNMFHIFLANAITNQWFVATTNFDYLIECSLIGILDADQKQNIIPVITKQDFLDYDNPQSLIKSGKYPVYKLHGSNKNYITGENTGETLITTTTALGDQSEKQGELFTMEVYKREFLLKNIKNKILVVLGYSGQDYFDIGPTLEELMGLKHIIWLDHRNEEDIENDDKEDHELLVKMDLFEVNKLDHSEIKYVEPGIDRALVKIRSDEYNNFKVFKITTDTAKFTKGLWKRIMPDIPITKSKSARISKIPTFYEWIENNIENPLNNKKFIFAMELFNEMGNFTELERIALNGMKMEDPYIKLISYKSYAACLSYKEDQDNAMRYSEKSLKLSRELNIEEKIADNLQNIGTIHMNKMEYDMALENFEAALKISEKFNFLNLKSSILNSIGHYHETIGELDKALEIFFNCNKINRKSSSLINIRTTCSSISRIYYKKRNWKKALNWISEALEIAENLGDLKSIAEISNFIGSIFFYKNDYDETIYNYTKALKIYKNLNMHSFIVNTSINLGNVYSKKGDFTKAMELFDNSLQIINKYDYTRQKPYLFRNIASTLSKQGEHENSIKKYNEAVEIAKKLNDQQQIALVYNEIAQEYENLKNFEKAIVYYDLSSQLFNQLNQKLNADAVEGNKKAMISRVGC